jgi:hypothetical protein
LALFTPNTTLATLRRTCAAAGEATKLSAERADLQLLRRVPRVQNSTFRLSLLAGDPLSRRELDTAAARVWRAALADGAARERTALAGCRSSNIKETVADMLGGIDTDLVALENQLGK